MLYVLAVLILADLQNLTNLTIFKMLLPLNQKNLRIFPFEITNIFSQKLLITLTLA